MRVVPALLLLCAALLGGAPACSRSAPAGPPLEIRGRRIDIEATAGGYHPSTVEVKPGEQVTLVFKRTIESHCLSEIAVPSLGIKKELPLNQPVAIPFQADRPGDVAFACGMDMVHGTIAVK